MDTRKSLAELSGLDWGPPPERASILVRERHELRRTALCEPSDAGLARLIGLGSEPDLALLIPCALDRLRADPEATALLYALLRAGPFPWADHPAFVIALRDAAHETLADLAQFTDDAERLHHEACVLRHWLQFERRLSSIEPLSVHW